MFTIYILKYRDGNHYIGFTSKLLSERLKEHLNGSNRSTKFKGTFKLVYFEKYEQQSIALAREQFFKTGDGRKVLKNKLADNIRAGAIKTSAPVRR